MLFRSSLRAKRGNPAFYLKGILDCRASLAMTAIRNDGFYWIA
jgi:hypothetical protein